MDSQSQRERAQYEFERRHRNAILNSRPGTERENAFTAAYSGLAKGIADGSFVNREEDTSKKAKEKSRLLLRLLKETDRCAEYGPGDGALALAIAPHVASLALVDVVPRPQGLALPKNCSWHQENGVGIPSSLSRLDCIWSSHAIEHIHPDDLPAHLLSVRRALKARGVYVLWTPNHFNGPHDISRNFSETAEGLHLKEYTVHELRRLFLHAGYRKVTCYAGGKGVYIRVPSYLPLFTESVLAMLPRSISKKLARTLPVAAILGIILIGQN